MKTPTEELIELRKIKKGLEKYKEKAEYTKSLESNITQQEMNLKYDRPIQNAIKNIEYYSNQIKEINERVVKYSTFYYKNIISVLRVLIRVYEGKNFILRDLKYQPNPERRIITEEARVLVNEERLSFINNNCDKNKLCSIQKNGDGIIFDWDINRKKYIKFYDITKDDDLKYNIKLNKFSYIKDFIDYVITFYYVNNIQKELSEQELFGLMQVFISENIEEIMKYHKEIKNKEEYEMKKQIEEKSEYRTKQLNKILNKFNGGNYEF